MLAQAATVAGSLALVVGLLGGAGAASSAVGHARLASSSLSLGTFEMAGCQSPTLLPGTYDLKAVGSAGQSGNLDSSNYVASGGPGDEVTAEITVTSSAETVEICVDSGGGAGGAGDGEYQTVGGNGGGASSVFVKSGSKYVPVVVAGGGGGAGGQGSVSNVGPNGGAAGEAGSPGYNYGNGGGGGGSAGSSTTGGSGGQNNYAPDGSPGGKWSSKSGEPGSGGSGGNESAYYGGGGGGGGGGYYGGGGGAGGNEYDGGSGGGGSDYCVKGGLSNSLDVAHCTVVAGAGTKYGAVGSFPSGSAEVVLKAFTTTTVTVTPNTTTYGSPVTYAATVLGSNGAKVTGGTVTFAANSTTLCTTATVRDGSASCTSTKAPAGTDKVIATYSGSSDYLGSSGTATTSLTVKKASTTTTVTVTPNTTTYGSPVTYAATVLGPNRAKVTGGTVTFGTRVTGVLCTTATVSDGSASCTSAKAHVGTDDDVTGTYSGSSDYLGSFGTAKLVVSAVPPPPPTPVPVAAPVLTGLVPDSGPATGGTTVTLDGTNLCAPSAVSFGSAAARIVSVSSACTQVVVTDPPGTAGTTVPVRLVNAGGTSNAETFTYTVPVVLKAAASPVVTSLSPSRGLSSGGETVTLDGANLCGVTAVDFGTSAASVLRTNAACSELAVADPPGEGTVAVTVTTSVGSTTAAEHFTYVAPGYRLVGADGGVFDFGHSAYAGSLPGLGVHVDDVVGTASDPTGGYWLVGADGGVFAFGGAPYLGSLPGLGITVHDITGIVADPGGQGYWLVGADGGVFAFGDAPYLGSLPGLGITVHDITGIVADPGGQGYWLVGADGGVFAFGDAPYLGSLPGLGITVHDVDGIVAVPGGQGYWLVAKDGGIFSFGDAPYLGSLPGLGITVHDITGIETTP